MIKLARALGHARSGVTYITEFPIRFSFPPLHHPPEVCSIHPLPPQFPRSQYSVCSPCNLRPVSELFAALNGARFIDIDSMPTFFLDGCGWYHIYAVSPTHAFFPFPLISSSGSMTTFFILESRWSTSPTIHSLCFDLDTLLYAQPPSRRTAQDPAWVLPTGYRPPQVPFNVQDLNSGTGLPQFSNTHVTTPVIPQTILARPTSTPVLGPHIAAAVGTPIRLAPSTSSFHMGSQFSCLLILILVAVRYEKVHQELELLFGQQNSSWGLRLEFGGAFSGTRQVTSSPCIILRKFIP